MPRSSTTVDHSTWPDSIRRGSSPAFGSRTKACIGAALHQAHSFTRIDKSDKELSSIYPLIQPYDFRQVILCVVPCSSQMASNIQATVVIFFVLVLFLTSRHTCPITFASMTDDRASCTISNCIYASLILRQAGNTFDPPLTTSGLATITPVNTLPPLPITTSPSTPFEPPPPPPSPPYPFHEPPDPATIMTSGFTPPATSTYPFQPPDPAPIMTSATSTYPFQEPTHPTSTMISVSTPPASRSAPGPSTTVTRSPSGVTKTRLSVKDIFAMVALVAVALVL